jgi:hypothetical protein
MASGKGRQGAAQPQGQWITKARRLSIYLRDNFTCLYCGTFLHQAKPSEITLDHLQPRSKGGTDQPSNLITACKSCNCSRGSKRWRLYASKEAVIQILNARRRVVNIELARAIIRGEAGDPRIEARDVMELEATA